MNSLRPIQEVAADLGIAAEHLSPRGHDKAKVSLDALAGRPPKGRLVLVSAVTPTKAGEGKTTVSVGLAMGLSRIGRNCALCLREPSLGPVFGIKGGGTGGGLAQIQPAEDINLHFTGDLHAISSAHNLLAALVDNDLHFGAKSGLDPRRVTWPRVLDMNDRALRSMVIGLGGTGDGVARQSRFDITAASEVMAVLSLASDIHDLRARLGRITVGTTKKGEAVTADQLGAAPAMTALLRDALNPNLVQTADGTPALVHGGPFANIAHGCSSVVSTRMGLAYADVTVTEAGFGFDLGGEKFLDIKCRTAGLSPSAVVLVATVRALQAHGDGDLTRGLGHLGRQIENVRRFGLPAVVALNVFPTDTDAQLAEVAGYCAHREVPSARITGFVDGGAGGVALAEQVAAVLDAAGEPPTIDHPYPLEATYEDKVRALARRVYGAADVAFGRDAQKTLASFEKRAPGLPVCVAKTHLSFSDDPKGGGLVEGHVPTVNEARLYAGAGFVTVLMGEISTMPGLPREPAALHVSMTPDGHVRGLMQGE